MPSAAGIIVATGAMTLGNGILQSNQPLSTVADKIDWTVIPATVIAAGMFYGIEQVSPPIAKLMAWMVFITAFSGAFGVFTYAGETSPLGTLLKLTQKSVPYPKEALPNLGPQTYNGLPYA